MLKNIRKQVPWMIGLVVTVLVALQANAIFPVRLVNLIDFFAYDVRMRLEVPQLNKDIIIVNIDEKSLTEVGQWPWKRSVVADLIKRLTDDYHVRAVGVDVVFPEPDGSSGFQILEGLAKNELKDDKGFAEQVAHLKHQLDFDDRLTKAFENRPVVLGYFFSDDKKAVSKGALPKPALLQTELGGRDVESAEYFSFIANMQQLQDAAIAGGFLTPTPDSDGVIRSIPLLAKYKSNYYEALSLATARVALNATRLKPKFSKDAESLQADTSKDDEIEAIVLNSSPRKTIPLEPLLRSLIQYKGKGGPDGGRFTYISAADVLKKQLPESALVDKIILIGTTAVGLKDLRTAPVGIDYPGVEMHANVIASILDNDFKVRPSDSRSIELIEVIFLGIVLTFALIRLKPVSAILFTLSCLLASIGFNYWMYQSFDKVLPLATPLLLIFSLFLFVFGWNYVVESRRLRGVVRRFGEYVAPELVAVMADEPDSYTMEGESRELTVMFSDVRGFTTISETLSAVDLREYINIYLTAMSEEIRGNRGTLDKYIGDAVMAFWGAPVRLTDHARRSVESALKMQVTAQRLSQEFVQRGWPALKIGIGLNTGEVRVGDMGSKIRLAYTVMGDAVNLSSRLEGVTKLYGVGIIVGEATKNAAPEFAYRELDRVRVKGKTQPISIFEPVGLAKFDAETTAILDLWHRALNSFRAQRWDEAATLFNEYLKTNVADLAAQVFLERIAYCRDHPPPADWDGVATFVSKFSE